MKKTSKALLLGLCAVLLVAASILGTMAYLTDNAKVENSFTLGKVEITLTEAKVNEKGKADNSVPRVVANSYKLVPGLTYDKDPTIYVKENSEDSYLFVKVEDEIKALENEGNTVEDQMVDSNKWKNVEGTSNVYVYTNGGDDPCSVTASVGKDGIKVFEHFTVRNTATKQDLIANKDNKIIITAYAVQANGWDGTGTDKAAYIWENAGFTK